ncbi:MAG: AIR synthase-related protein, partial [Fervidicoccaceae archaeon]
TKRAAMEATSIAAYDLEKFLIERGFSRMELEEAKKLIEKISVVPEAIALSSEKLAHAMHDATEGGIAAAAFELSYASGWAVEIDRNQIPIFSLTEKILGALGADPLFSLSSGTLLAAVPKSRINDALSKLSSIGVEASIIGKVTERRERKLYIKRGEVAEKIVEELPQDNFIERLEEIERGSQGRR